MSKLKMKKVFVFVVIATLIFLLLTFLFPNLIKCINSSNIELEQKWIKIGYTSLQICIAIYFTTKGVKYIRGKSKVRKF